MKKIGKVVIMLIFAILLYGKAYSLDVSAYGTYQYGNLYYTLTDDGKDVEITGCKDGVSDIVVPAKIDDMDVVGIQNSAFEKKKSLISIRMESVKSIGGAAFYKCDNLQQVYAPNSYVIGEYAFSGCVNLTDVKIAQTKNNFDESTSYIDEFAFANCKSLKNLNTGYIKKIGKEAFYDCSSLKNISMPYVSNVVGYVFKECTNLMTVDMPQVTDIGQSAFSGCSLLKVVNMPKVKIIYGNAFYGCTSLINVNMPKVEHMGDNAFVNTSLTKVSFSKNVSDIGSHALGYDYHQDKYGRDVWTKKEGFTIHCSNSGNIYAYTKDNGFKYQNHSLKTKSSSKATCTKDGKKVEVCSDCGFEKITTTSKYGHSYDKGKIKRKPTNTKDGQKVYTCKRCGETKISVLKSYKTLANKKYWRYIDGLWNCKTKIVDVDKNGIPELLIKDNDNWKVVAYTYNPSTSKMVKLKSLQFGKGGLLRYNVKNHYLSFVTADTGGYREYMYKLSGSKLKKVRTIEWCNGRFEKQGYKIKKKRISTAKYKKYLKGFKTIK